MPLDVLLIQDNPILARLWETALRDEGLRVRSVATGHEGLELALAQKPQAILVDSLMPEITGYDFCVALEKNKELSDISKVVFVSHFNLASKIKRVTQAGAAGYWLKYELDASGLARRIHALLFPDEASEEALQDPAEGNRRSWVEQFRAARLLTDEQLAHVRILVEKGWDEVRALLQLRIFPDSEERFLWELFYRTDSVDLDAHRPDTDLARLLPENLALGLRAIPIGLHGENLMVATSNPSDVHLLDAIATATGHKVHAVYAQPHQIDAAIMLVYSGKELHEEAERLVRSGMMRQAEAFLGDRTLDQVVNEQPVTEFIDSLIFRALYEKASDIHLETKDDVMLVRMRVDGIMHDHQELPATMSRALAARVKIMAGMNVVERRLPQDGRFSLTVQKRKLDFRVSTVPTVEGEKVVIRVLNPEAGPEELEKLGMETEQVLRFGGLIDDPHGMLLVTGPTGSGKTTTLYAALRRINTPAVNIVTIEDPVEFRIRRANQIQVNPEIGLTFASILRSVLRQDPDIVMVGEIRDVETAELAVQASLTGHMVLGTLHTNDAPGTVLRLLDMGLPPYIVASTITGVLAQRLLRTICSYCKEEVKGGDERFPEAKTLFRGRGCVRCRNSGYKGRMGIFELMPVTHSLRRAIVTSTELDRLHELATKDGMITLREAARRKVLEGITTVDEMWRVTREDEEERETAFVTAGGRAVTKATKPKRGRAKTRK